MMYVIAFNDLMNAPLKTYTDNSGVLELVAKGYTVYLPGNGQIACSIKGDLYWKDIEETQSIKNLADYSEVI